MLIKERKISYFEPQPKSFTKVEKLYVVKILILNLIRYLELRYPQFNKVEFLKAINLSDLDDQDLFAKYFFEDLDLLVEELQKIDPDDKAFSINIALDGIGSNMGSFSFFILNSPNFIDTLKKVSTFSHILTNIVSSMIMEKTEDHFRLYHHFSRETLKFKETTKAAILELHYGVIANQYNETSFNKHLGLEFHSSYNHRLSDEEITSLLGHKFVSNSDRDKILIPLEVEKITNQRYETNLPPVVSSGLSKHLESKNVGSLSSKIINLLEVNPEYSLEEISKRMLISKRTLQRRLQEQNVSFTSLKQNAINTKSIELLNENKHSIVEIAKILGYSTSASFIHAFSKWHGVSPSQYLRDKNL